MPYNFRISFLKLVDEGVVDPFSTFNYKYIMGSLVTKCPTLENLASL